jgi:secreted trypsin-like serine protease
MLVINDFFLHFCSGWGRTVAGGPSANVLQKAVLPIAHFNHCSERYNRIGIRVDYHSMLCAGGQGLSGACQGDSGGPLACLEGGKWTLRGVVSWGTKQCHTHHYSVFAKVSSFVTWMRGAANRG